LVDFLDGKSIEEVTEELEKDLIGNKTIEEIDLKSTVGRAVKPIMFSHQLVDDIKSLAD
jgi:hypothetical protein